MEKIKIFGLLFLFVLINYCSGETMRKNHRYVEVTSPVNHPSLFNASFLTSNIVQFFGAYFGGFPENPLVADLLIADPYIGCSPLTNNMTGKYCVVQRGGGCNYGPKAAYCEAAGAVGTLVVNTLQGMTPLLSTSLPAAFKPVMLIDINVGEKWRNYSLSNPANPIQVSIPYGNCAGHKNITNGYGTFQTSQGNQVYSASAKCNWNLQNPQLNSTTTSIGFFLSEFVDSQPISITSVYETHPDHTQTLLSAAASGPNVDNQQLFTACAPNSLQVDFNGAASRVCASLHPYDQCDFGFVGNYYTCPGPSRLNAQTGLFSPGCGAVRNCSWILETVDVFGAKGIDIAIYFSNVTLQPGAEIMIYDGDFTSGTANLVSTITSQTTVVPFVISTTGYLSIDYKTDSAAIAVGSSFTGIFHNGACNRHTLMIEPMKGSFRDGTLTDGIEVTNLYASNSDCKWLLDTPGTHPLIPVTISFQSISLLLGDKLIVYDGDSESAAILYSWNLGDPFPILTSSSQQMLITFTTDANFVGQGWSVEYEYAYCGTEVQLNNGAGSISQGNWHALGLTYDHKSMTEQQLHVLEPTIPCSWIINGLVGANYIEIFFQSMDLSSPDDYIEIYDKDSGLVASFQDTTKMPSSLLIRSPSVTVKYYTETGNDSTSSFTSIYNAGKCFGGAPLYKYELNGTINDGSFDDIVKPNLECTWIIQPDFSETSIHQTRVIRITIQSLSLFGLDILKIYAGERLINTLDGNSRPMTIEAFSTYVKLEFATDPSTYVRFGWDLKYTADDGCPPGYIINSTETTCTRCPNGYESAGGQTAVCTICPAGTYSSSSTGGLCRPCPLGTFQHQTGRSSCFSCSRGYYAGTTGSLNCTACEKGTFNINEGSSSCDLCQAGQFQDREGQSKCFPCDKTAYASHNGSAICTLCPNNTIATIVGAYDLNQCICEQDFYGYRGEICTACPNGAYCAGNESIPVPQYGYWQSNVNPLVMVKCYPSEACLGGPNNLCGDGYHGPRCGGCKEGPPTRYYRLNDKCTVCPSTPAWWMVLTVLIPIVFCFWLLQSVSRNFKSGSIAIGFDFMQILALTSSFRLEWPSSIKDVYSALSFLNFNIELVAPECTMHADYWSKWWLILALPMVMLGVFLVIFGILKAIVMLFPRVSKRQVAFLFNKDYFINGYVMFLSLVHPLLLSKSLEVFDCVEDGAGGSYMMEHQIQDCHVPSWNSKVPVAIIGIILYGVGIPVMFFFVLLFYRKRLHEPSIIAKFGSIYFCYAHDRFFWEVIVKMKKFSLVIVRFIFSNGDEGNGTLWTAAIGAVILMFYFLASVYYRPFAFRRNNGLQIGVALINIGAVFSGILFFSQKFTDDSAAILRTVLFAIFFVTVVCIAFHVVREFFYGFRTSKRMKEMIPNFLFRYNIFSLSETEMADIPDGFSAKPLFQNMDDWLHLHSRKEREELLEALEPLGISNIATRLTFWETLKRIGNDVLRRPDRSTKIHSVASSVREVEMKTRTKSDKKSFGNNLSLDVVSNDM